MACLDRGIPGAPLARGGTTGSAIAIGGERRAEKPRITARANRPKSAMLIGRSSDL